MTASDLVGLVARGLLAGVFAFAATAKLRDRTATRAALVASGLSPGLDGSLVLVEAFTALGLLVERRTVWAAWVACGVLVIFTVFVARSLARGVRAPCPCFGSGPNAGPISGRTLARNLGLCAIAVLATVPSSSRYWITWVTAALVVLGLSAWRRFSSRPAMP